MRVVNGEYWLLKATSKRVEGKKYPIPVQEYIGIITEDKVHYPFNVNIGTTLNTIMGINHHSWLRLSHIGS